MDKKKVISRVIKASKLYKSNLEDQTVLFVYGIPSVIKKQIQDGEKNIKELHTYEVSFHRANFMHLTGLKINKLTVKSAINFYTKCIDGRLKQDDFYLSKDGTSIQKLDVLESMMEIKKTASMIGDFTDEGPKLYSEKVAGNTFACMGFVEDKYTKRNVPNTLLKKDVREVSSKPQQKIYAVLSKNYSESKYSIIEKCDKDIELSLIESLKPLIDIHK